MAAAALALAGLAAGDAAADAAQCAALRTMFDGEQVVLATRWRDDTCTALGEAADGGRFALALPEIWNERMILLGCEGFCGRLNPTTAEAWAERGYAALSSDGGHRAADPESADWGHKNPAAERRWAGDGAVAALRAARAVLRRYHPEDLRFTYAAGCRDAARQGFAVAARAPELMDGVLAVAPILDPGGFYGPVLAARLPALAALRAEDHDALADAALETCETADGVVAHPPACDFAPEAEAARPLFADPRDGFDDVLAIGRLAPGFSSPDAEAQDMLARRHEGFLRHLSTEFEMGEFWSLQDYDFDREPVDGAAARERYRIDGDDLTAFFARGGRALIVQGWADGVVSPYATAEFADQAGDGAAAYFGAGRNGCPESDDALMALEGWVEVGAEPPAELAAPDGPPLCLWPGRLGADGACAPD